MKKVFWEELEEVKDTERMGYRKWIGKTVRFEYDDINGLIEILDYKNSKLKLKYNDNTYDILVGGFKGARIGTLIGTYTTEFKYEIGQVIKDEKRDITIIDRKVVKDGSVKNAKYYKYRCNKCGYSCGEHYKLGELVSESFVIQSSLLRGTGCACCCESSQVVVVGINDIPTTAPWMIEYFQGGYEEAKSYSIGSKVQIEFICPRCGCKRNNGLRINTLYETHSISCICSDGISAPEKIMLSLLKQLGIDFIYQASIKNLDWICRYKYDFYIPLHNIIIETHGEQHPNTKYYRANNRFEERTMKKGVSILSNDINKRKLALSNGIKKYVIIDCSKTSLEFIKESILNSYISDIYDLSIIDWNKCLEDAYKSLIIDVCNHYNKTKDSMANLVKALGLDRGTIKKYLTIGSEIGLCTYN